ncbi:MAG: hypothetical protein PW788_04315 [Micavibrio sp.]|nr:hypothetical protein [Micavibrio sp.]
MRWAAISGSWRTVDETVAQDVRAEVKALLAAGNGIVTGGALGVDYIATDEALKNDPAARQIKIIIPTSLSDYANHYFKKGEEGVITPKQASDLIAQLTEVKRRNPGAVEEMSYTACNTESYFARNGRVIAESQDLLAFQVNDSPGTQDTIDKAKAAGMQVIHRKYSI